MSVLEGKLQLLSVKARGGGVAAHRGAQSKGMCLWWLLSHRSWQAGEMWRGRFTRIKWACLTFLICTSGSLTKTANLELKEKRPSPPIIGDTPIWGDVHWSVSREPLLGCAGVLHRCCVPSCVHMRVLTNTHTYAHMVLFIWIKPTEPLRSLYFSAAWFICSSCRPASLPPSLSVSLSPPVPLSVSCSLLPAVSSFLLHVVFIQLLCSISKIYGKLDELSLPAAMNIQRMWEVECFNRDVKHWRVIMNYTAKGG